MPDSINIGITATDNTAGGVNSAIGNLNKLNSATAGFGTTTTSARAIMEGWTKSQYAAAIAGENLTTKALKLEQAVNSGKMTVQDATTAYKEFERQQKANVWQAMTFGEKYRSVSATVNDSVKTIGTAALKFGAVAAGIGYATKQVFEFAQAGAEIEYTRQKFDRLAVSVGTTGDVFLNQLRVATKGTVSDFGLLKQGSDLLQLGLAKDSQEAVRLSKVMTALGMDTGELTLALANQSKRRLDQLGLSLSKFNEIEDRLKGTGMTKEERFKEAFLQTAEQTVMLTGNRADTAAGTYARTEAELQNIKDAAKVQTMRAISGDVQNFSNFFRAWNAVQRGEMQWGGNLGQMLMGTAPVIRPTNGMDRALAAYGQFAGPYQSQGMGAGISYQQYQQQAASYYAAQVGRQKAEDVSSGKYGKAPTAAAAPEIDYAGILQGGMQLTKMTQAYSEKTADLNAKLAEEQTALADLTRRYGENSAKTQEQAEKVEALKEGVNDLKSEYNDAMSNMGLASAQAAGATDEQQLRFARASGMITQDAYETQTGLNKLAAAYAKGSISADAYASAVQNVTKWASGMNEQQFNTYIDVWVRIHGNAGVLDQIAGTGGASYAAVKKGGKKGKSAKAAGGPLNPNDVTIVGEGASGWSPTAEVIADGVVYPHSIAQQLKDAGLLEGASRAMFGSSQDLEEARAVIAGNVATRRAARHSATTTTKKKGSATVADIAEVTGAALAEDRGAIVQATNASAAMSARMQQQSNNYLAQTVALLQQIAQGQPTAAQQARAARTAASMQS